MTLFDPQAGSAVYIGVDSLEELADLELIEPPFPDSAGPQLPESQSVEKSSW